MNEIFREFERIVRLSYKHNDARSEPSGGYHPFDERDIHPKIQQVSKGLFDDGYFTQATFEAFKFIEKEVQKISSLSRDMGFKLMMKAFGKNDRKIMLNNLTSMSDEDEQEGYRFMFAGGVLGIRNPRGHECDIRDTPDQCLDHLSFASLLLKKLEDSVKET